MKTYDWIVIGGGITGAALSYELAIKGFTVLLLEQHTSLQGATRYSYGGLSYWAGSTNLTRQLCAEGKERHRHLSAELGSPTQFRELDLVLTIARNQDPEIVAQSYSHCASPPQLVSVEQACALEPLLNPEAIAAALTVRHGHIAPGLTTQAYWQAFIRAGGVIQIESVNGLLRQGDRIRGVTTPTQMHHAANVVVCAGGLSRALLQSTGIHVRVYFTHAELLETPPVDLRLQSLVVPAVTERFELEAKAGSDENEPLWNESGQEIVPPILDTGAIQFMDGSIRIGQISRVLSDLKAQIDPAQSEAQIRASIGKVLPALQDLPATWHSCLVAFSGDRLPLIGAVPDVAGVHLFSGFSNPLTIVPPLAQRFANHVAGDNDPIIAQLSPTRFIKIP